MRKKETRVWIEFENPRDDHFKDEKFEVVTTRLAKEYTDFFHRLGLGSGYKVWWHIQKYEASWAVGNPDMGFKTTDMKMPGTWLNVNYLALPKHKKGDE